MAQQLFWYKGKNTNGQRIEGLTWEQVAQLEKEEKEMIQEEQLNARVGPALNKEIGGYVKANPSADPRGSMTSMQTGSQVEQAQSTPQQKPAVNAFALGSEGFNNALDSLSGLAQEPSSSLSGIPSSDQQSSRNMQVDTQSAYNGILKGIPEDIAKDLIWQYHNGIIKPKEFLKEISATKKALNDIKLEETKANQASARKIREEGMKSQGEIDKQYVISEGQMDLANVNNAASLQRQREENTSRERVAALNNNGDGSGKNSDKYSERTFALKPGQIENLISYDDAEAQINTVKNLYDKNYTGFVKGRIGSVKDFFGALPEKEAIFRSAKQKFDNAMIKLQAGGAVTKQEAERMIKELGDFTKGPEQFNAILDRTLSTIGNSKSIYVNGLKKSKYDVGEWGKEVEPIDLSGGLNKKETPKPAIQAPDNNTRVVNGVTFRKVNGGWQRQ